MARRAARKAARAGLEFGATEGEPRPALTASWTIFCYSALSSPMPAAPQLLLSARGGGAGRGSADGGAPSAWPCRWVCDSRGSASAVWPWRWCTSCRWRCSCSIISWAWSCSWRSVRCSHRPNSTSKRRRSAAHPRPATRAPATTAAPLRPGSRRRRGGAAG